MQVDESLLPFATERQAEAIRAYLEHGYKGGCKFLGINESSFGNLLSRVKRRAALAGHAPEHGMTHVVPDPFVVKGTSTLYDEDGKPRMQWVKTSLDHQKKLDLIQEVIDELKQDITPCQPIPLSGWLQPDDLLNFYVLSDIHLGALSWGEETGSDWDISIAEETIVQALQHLIQHAPASKNGFFCQLGDALHTDGLSPVTPSSGHVVDVDSRYHKIVRASIRIFRKVIAMLLEKHETVSVLMAQGNHDLSGSVWLQEVFAALFENNNRCQIIVNPSPYYSVKFGRVFLGMHHGHRSKMEKLVSVFTGKKYWESIGECRQAYIHTGHQHHREVKEFNGGIVEMHPTLAAPSSYEAHGGYDADRSMACITYHSDGYEQSRVLFYPKSVRKS
jgi:hypothetical protein